MNVGRDHVGSLVNTLVLAYTGSGPVAARPAARLRGDRRPGLQPRAGRDRGGPHAGRLGRPDPRRADHHGPGRLVVPRRPPAAEAGRAPARPRATEAAAMATPLDPSSPLAPRPRGVPRAAIGARFGVPVGLAVVYLAGLSLGARPEPRALRPSGVAAPLRSPACWCKRRSSSIGFLAWAYDRVGRATVGFGAARTLGRDGRRDRPGARAAAVRRLRARALLRRRLGRPCCRSGPCSRRWGAPPPSST